jgi:hypothetical protein
VRDPAGGKHGDQHAAAGEFHGFALEDAGGPAGRGRRLDRRQVRVLEFERAAGGVFERSGDFGFDLQMAQAVGQLPRLRPVVRRAEEPAVDRLVHALIEEGEGEQHGVRERHDQAHVNGLGNGRAPGQDPEMRELRDCDEDSGPSAGKEDADTVAQKEIGEPKAGEQQKGKQDHQ